MSDFQHKSGLTIAVLGTGAWGGTLAHLARQRGNEVRTWSRRSAVSMEDAVRDADIVVSAISMKGVPSVIERLSGIGLPSKTILVTATKGLEYSSLKTPSQLWQAAFPRNPVVVISGPNLSKEIMRGQPAATVMASRWERPAEISKRAFESHKFHVFTSSDPLGAELGGTLKNVFAIAVGYCDAMDMGTNAKSAIITRALAEMVQVGQYFGAHPETFAGLSGLGDLLATCSSPLSRNYQVGFRLARGENTEQILNKLKGTAEGVNTAGTLAKISKEDVRLEIPTIFKVYLLTQGVCERNTLFAGFLGKNLGKHDFPAAA
ncbi:MAG: NAD(P)H-dependent glycerol-3-phosphate dehydrogenase [Cyanobacteria bacterium P01_G01_bin.4]